MLTRASAVWLRHNVLVARTRTCKGSGTHSQTVFETGLYSTTCIFLNVPKIDQVKMIIDFLNRYIKIHSITKYQNHPYRVGVGDSFQEELVLYSDHAGQRVNVEVVRRSLISHDGVLDVAALENTRKAGLNLQPQQYCTNILYDECSRCIATQSFDLYVLEVSFDREGILSNYKQDSCSKI